MDQDDIYYHAMLSRDYRFDGKFYIAVKTTGIYCRPICPAKPLRKNVEFFLDSYSAEKAGYRPCLRCHPEFSPNSLSCSGKSSIVQNALQLISQNVMFDISIEEFANQLGVSARHLRRLFDEEMGLSPKKISDMHRLNFAQKLIVETTNLNLTDIALASGFCSLRRFNDAFIKRYHCSPSQIRKHKLKKPNNIFTLHVAYRPPFDWKNALLYYANHQIPFLEEVTDSSYQRVFKINSSIGLVTIKNDENNSQLELKIDCEDPKVLFPVVNRVRKMFDLDSDPFLINQQFAISPVLKELWKEFPGLRITTGWDPFEIAIGTILGQVVSIKQASHLMGELVRMHGEKIIHPVTQKENFLFPTPEILIEASLEKLKSTNQRKKAIKNLCQNLIDNTIRLDQFQNFENLKKQLRLIEGIGSWSAEYICLRGLGDTNAFPSDDLILKRALTLNINTFDSNQFAPWRGYLAIYLWKKYAHTLSRKKNATPQI